MDGASAITAGLLDIMRIRRMEEEDEFDSEAEMCTLLGLLDKEYARSVYWSSVSHASVQSHSMYIHSEATSIGANGRRFSINQAAILCFILSVGKSSHKMIVWRIRSYS